MTQESLSSGKADTYYSYPTYFVTEKKENGTNSMKFFERICLRFPATSDIFLI